MNKSLLVGCVAIAAFSIGFAPSIATAATTTKTAKVVRVVKPKAYSEGWLETFQGGSVAQAQFPSLSGWAYDSGKGVVVTATLVSSDGTIVTSSGSVDGYRGDVNTYLKGKVKTEINVPVAFTVYFPNVSKSGVYRIKSATYNGRTFKVADQASRTQSIGLNHNLRLYISDGNYSSYATTARAVSIGQEMRIGWYDENPTNALYQSYSVFITDRFGSAYGVLPTVTNQKDVTWTVGSNLSNRALSPGDTFKIQVVKQYVEGEGTTIESGDYIVLPTGVDADAYSQSVDELINIRKLSVALNATYTAKATYPSELSELPNSLYSASQFSTWSNARTGVCANTALIYPYTKLSSSTYRVEFCLPAAIEAFSAGTHVLTERGIQ